MSENESIDFSAKYKEWVVIKKASILPDTKPEEVAFHLASIRQTIDRKAFEILGIETKILDDYAASVTNGMRKSYKDMAQAVQSLGSPKAKEAVSKVCGSKSELEEPAKTYLFRKVIQTLGFDFDVNQQMLAKVYPNLKLPKPRGRQPKKGSDSSVKA
jgi:hypothetical protein